MEYTNQQTPVSNGTQPEETPLSISSDMIASGLRIMSTVLTLATALAVFVILRRRHRPKTWRDRLEDTFSSGRDSMAQAVDNLEREVKRLRRVVEERLPNA
ncbi:MAG: hypothetical protein IT320_22810 [Anaerolineae bacterium]|nr:hypothetical protein [Anaerolineae bacterium]